MIEFLQHLFNGLSLGSTYALIAIGYTMVFGVLQLINFAHGDVFMLGAFFGILTAKFFHFNTAPSFHALVITIVISMIACAAIGFLIEFLAYRPLRKAPRINVLITAVGVSLLLQNASQLIFGSDPKYFPQIFSAGEAWDLGGVRILPIQFINFGLAMLLMFLLQYLVFHTKLGTALRAVSFNHELSSLMGIPTNKVIALTFMLGSALAGAAGVMTALTYPKVDPFIGILPGLKAFSAAVLGGIGNIKGALVGALLLGLCEQMVVAYIAPSMRDALAFFILIGILLLKPAGLFGIHRAEKV
jgi:branched-chain amino acid transport system permease protein